MKANKKEYLERLVASVENYIENHPDTINAGEYDGEKLIPASLCDLILLCMVIRKDVLGKRREDS